MLSDTKRRERFWQKVEKMPNGCWLWRGKTHKLKWGNHPNGGYGVIRINHQEVMTHRLSYEWAHGPTTEDVCHTCDTPPCVNPGHLYPGNDITNAHDRVIRNRSNAQRGEVHANAKLTGENVKEIRRLYALNKSTTRYARKLYSQARLAKMFSVSQDTIYKVLNDLTWESVG